ncbi:exosome complex exonuclease-like protein Rrp40 [Amniculicola lignicola CBS 123094]|uniref:Exosome complex exonuclease-like protein Rrp40 n=1 Tax=Amniculicola lignicola CBS 123094 TaxID=1392246 RepID=A0A6A5X3S5_9PLEO|nr:exosome complex exonuclease-like protein Rrp40 [Amniculicola lignicola CBS 123094]
MAATTATIVLPGDLIPQDALPAPQNKKKVLKLGPGLRQTPPTIISASIAGALVADARKGSAWIETNSGRYTPTANDLVIATIASSAGESFNCTLTPHTPTALLPHLSFEGATRKTRPILVPNSLVYARILTASTQVSPELTCVDASTGKSDGLGQLKGGMVFGVSLGMARRMLDRRNGGVVVLEGLSEKMGFEVAVGRNGVVWVDANEVGKTLAVGRAVQEVDELGLGEKAQRKLVERVLRGVA